MKKKQLHEQTFASRSEAKVCSCRQQIANINIIVFERYVFLHGLGWEAVVMWESRNEGKKTYGAEALCRLTV